MNELKKMTQEDKELLLKDLCARLPYHCRVFYEYVDDLDNKTYGYSLTLNTWCIDEFTANKAVIKPYLRPMSSMTESEKKEFESFGWRVDELDDNYPWVHIGQIENVLLGLNWLNVHYLDYRGLIPMNLALEASKDMYKIN